MKSFPLFLIVYILSNIYVWSAPHKIPPCRKLIAPIDLSKRSDVSALVTFMETTYNSECGEPILKSCSRGFGPDKENFEIKCNAEKQDSYLKIKVRKDRYHGLVIKEMIITSRDKQSN